MLIPLAASVGLFSAAIHAQDRFEPDNFDVIDALSRNGVNISSLNQLTGAQGYPFLKGCSAACNILRSVFGDENVEYSNEAAYKTILDSFWSLQQREPQPQCIFRPGKSTDVSTLTLLSRLTQCPFAVRSGGHASFAGASSINGGITVTFEKMKEITLSSDKTIASIEPGNRWYDAYTALAPHNVTVVGGRVSDIGVGGLTTGGGISFFSNLYGWACDNVASYEVVTACGAIVTASPTSYPDLYWALRGGGNNFGIVTKFNLETFPHGPLMFGGQRRFFNTSFPATIDAFVDIGSSEVQDTKAAQYVAIALDASSGTQVAVAALTYADPVPSPAIFEAYRQIPTFGDDTKLNTLANITQELNASNPSGFRETYWTASSKLDRQMVEYLFNISFVEFATIQDVKGIVPANTLQIITIPQLQQMQKKGGNALGINPADGPIFLINLSMRWESAEDDERVLAANRNIVMKMKDEAARRGLENDYLYMNYASQFQDVIASYGENKERLKKVAGKYDPAQVFQKLQPGYFKLDGPPAAWQ